MRGPIRLKRETPVARQAGGSALIGVVLTVLGGGILVAARTVAPSIGPDEVLAHVIGIAFLLVGVMMLFFGIKMAFMARLPETIVEVDTMPVRAGESFQVTVRQPGPIRLESLRLNVVGEQVTRRESWRNGKKRKNTYRHLIHQANVIDLQDLAVASGEDAIGHGSATVPAQIELIDVDGTKVVVWRLEVWGRVRGWVNFGHAFVITVSGGVKQQSTQAAR